MKIKKFISLLASLAMMVTAVTGAMTASASEVANGTCGDLTWTLDSDGVLTLSGQGEMDTPEFDVDNSNRGGTKDLIPTKLGDYSDIYTYKKEYKEDIKEVVIEEGVTSIGFCAFYKMPNLEAVTLPSTISDFTGFPYFEGAVNSGDWYIASYAFGECPSLKNLILSEGMTAIGGYAFYGCTSLESVRIPTTILSTIIVKPVLGGVYSWQPYSFAHCSNLKDVTLPEGLKIIGSYAFSETAVKNVVIPTTIEKKESWLCSGDNKISGHETKSGVNVNGAFAYCEKLSSVKFTEGLKAIGYSPFYKCSSLKRLTIPKSVTDMQYAFSECIGLEEAYIEEGAQISAYGNHDSYFDHSFAYCENLKKVEMFEGVNTISNNPWCEGCNSLTDVYVHGMNSSISRISDSVTIHCDFGSKIYKSSAYLNKKIEIEEDIENALKELNTAVTEAEKYAEADYTTESYGALKTALENAKKYDENSTFLLPIEWAADDIMTAIAGLEEKKDEPSSSDPSYSSNPSDNSSDPSNSSGNNNQSQSPNTPATPSTSAPTTATPKPITPPTVKTAAAKPAKVKAVKVKAKKKKLNVSWKKVSGATGYEIQYATNNKFTKGKKTVTVKKNKVTLKKLKPKKKYFVKVRAYKLANGRKYFGKWSKVVKKKTK